jgi:hypothetical protein
VKRPTYPNYIQDAFDRDVAEHEMTILLDQGLYRHLRFKRPNTGLGHFDVVTWPGSLAIGGDRDAFVFSRLPDMFEFFRSPDGRINPDYWSEKIIDGRERAKRYSEDVARERIWSAVRDEYQASGETAKGLAKAVQEGICDPYWCDSLACGDSARAAIDGFKYGRDGYEFWFEDSWEWNLRDWDYHYLWACHAIVWGIRQYDARKLTPEQWLATRDLTGTTILDYDGWTKEEWPKPIGRQEFERRLSLCTIVVAAPDGAREVAS